jgi:hypothetical protein
MTLSAFFRSLLFLRQIMFTVFGYSSSRPATQANFCRAKPRFFSAWFSLVQLVIDRPRARTRVNW